LTFISEYISNRELEVMDINDRDERANETVGGPVIEPKGGGS